MPYYHGSASYAIGQFTTPAALPADFFGLSGGCAIGQQAITAGQGMGMELAYHASYVYLDLGGTGTLTVTADGKTQVIQVSGASDIYTVASQPSPRGGTVSIKLSPGLAAYSFTFG